MYKIKKISAGFLLVFALYSSAQAWPQWLDDWYAEQDDVRVGQMAIGAAAGGILVGLSTYFYNMFCGGNAQKSEASASGYEGLLGETEITEHSFDDFIGYPKIIERLRGFVTSVKNTDAHIQSGSSRLRGILLEGDRKMGKTMLARIFSKEVGARLVEVTEKDLCAQGDPEAGLRGIFDELKEQSKQERTVLLLRDGNALFDMKDLATELFESLGPEDDLLVIVEMRPFVDPFFGCTIAIDEDLLRIWGMERVTIDLPSSEGSKEILKHCVSKHEPEPYLLQDVVLDRFARVFKGPFVVIKSLVEHAARRKVDQHDDLLKADHLNAELLSILGGLEADMPQTEAEKRQVAVHEAGHAITAVCSGQPVQCVSILPHERFKGVCLSLPDSVFFHNQTEIKQNILIGLGGPCAEKVVYNASGPGVIGDLRQVGAYVADMVCRLGMGEGVCEFAVPEMFLSEKRKVLFDDASLNIFEECRELTFGFLESKRDLIDALTNALMASPTGTLYGEDVHEIIGQPRDETSMLFFQQ